MDGDPSSWVLLALALAAASAVLSVAALWRSGARKELEGIRRKQQLVLDELSRLIRRGLDETLARVTRAQLRVGDLRKEAGAHDARETIDGIAGELAEIKRETELALERLKTAVTEGAQAAQELLAHRVHHIEANIRILTARAEIRAAERLADLGELVDAEDLLEDAVAKIREAKMRLADEGAEEPAFGPVIEALHDAIHSVRARAADHKRQIDTVLSASDSLLTHLTR